MKPRLRFTRMMEREKYREATAYEPKHTILPIKHGEGNFIALACMAASGTGPIGFTDDMTAEGGSRINFEVYNSILFAEIYSNAVKHRATSHSAN